MDHAPGVQSGAVPQLVALTGPLPQRMAESMGRTLDVTSESVAPALPSAVWGEAERGAIPCSSD